MFSKVYSLESISFKTERLDSGCVVYIQRLPRFTQHITLSELRKLIKGLNAIAEYLEGEGIQ